MKSFILLLSWLVLIQPRLIAQTNTGQEIIDSINNTFTYETGVVFIGDGTIRLTVPKGFNYLNAEQSRRVLVDLWGNSQDVATQGMLFPAGSGPLTNKSWAFNINYEEIGHINDEDADDIDHDYLLMGMQKNTEAENEDRAIKGHQPITLVGWASPPVYDKTCNVLHWAAEFKFNDATRANSLSYDVRILGRRGVVSLNAVADISALPPIKQHIPAAIGSVTFERGNRYVDFEPTTDQVAAVDVGGLVTGKSMVKPEASVVRAEFWKLLVLMVIGGAAVIQHFVGHQTSEKEPT